MTVFFGWFKKVRSWKTV